MVVFFGCDLGDMVEPGRPLMQMVNSWVIRRFVPRRE